MAVKEKQSETSIEEIEWNVENEIQLFFAMNGHKPVGVNKYFHMVCIWEKFRTAIHKDINLKLIWDHLESMYDLLALDDMEDLPFPSNETEFSLPEIDFMETIESRKRDESETRLKNQKDKYNMKKDKDTKDIVKAFTEFKRELDLGKTKEARRESKLRDVKDIKKEHKLSKGRPKIKEEFDEHLGSSKKERKDSETSRESLKRAPKRPTRQSVDSSSKTSSSPRDTPPPKRRRI